VADKLLVRVYNVEVGDCIYCRIPKARKVGGVIDDFHILIDCGSVGPAAPLAVAIADVESMLPTLAGGKKRLDLLVVTHEHKDHISGFDPARFANIKIERIWMNAAMDPEHPQAGRTLELHRLATVAMRNLAALNLSLSPELQELVALYAVTNDAAMEALRETLPDDNGISPTYVHAGMTLAELGLPLHGAKIRVLGPEEDIDRYYLGAEADEDLQGLISAGAAFGNKPPRPLTVFPENISRADFRRLQSRMLSSAFGFAELSNKVTNNTSIVMLIEWKGKRLLFVGDAEPGGIVRFKETMVDRIRACARQELGAEVTSDAAPIHLLEGVRSEDTRGHHVSMLFRCRLLTPPVESLRASASPPSAGHWRWHDRCPPDLLEEQRDYARFF
jgi:hypothetical protein